MKSAIKGLGWSAAIAAGALFGIAAGLALRLGGASTTSATVWMATLVATGIPVVARTARGVARGRFAADLVATLAIVAAAALGQPLAGLIVVLMQTGGEALERHAVGRASRAVEELERARPTMAHRLKGAMERRREGESGGAEDIDVEAIAVGDLLLIRPGELLPCDAVVIKGRSDVNVSRISGEPVPISAAPGTRLLSGSQNGEGPLTVRATAPARESQYARIVELVRSAQASKAPLQRLADRYAVWFTPLTLAVCVLAYIVTGDPVRVLAVLVVATPCPLILATPVAIVGGINRAARRGILFRHGTALEQLAGVDVAVFDKTGTLTIGRPKVRTVTALDGFATEEVLRLAGAVEQGSSHLLARTVVDAVHAHGLQLPEAHDVAEAPGQGISGIAGGRTVTVGGWSYVTGRCPASLSDFQDSAAVPVDGELRAFVAIDGRGAGVIDYADEIRDGLPALFASLRRHGIGRLMLLSGDQTASARRVGARVGIDEIHGDLLPAQKTAIVQGLVKAGSRVLMVGDGTNDAPALSAATVGIALASGGGGITAEAADAVLLADDPTRIADAVAVSRRTLRIARQSIMTGLALSGVAMRIAAAGYIPPVAGAMLQEAIDVAVILNALRAAAAPRGVSPAWAGVPSMPGDDVIPNTSA